MASAAFATFSIEVNGVPKVLFSARVSKKDDLYLTLRGASKFRDYGVRYEDRGETTEHGRDVVEQRYSVHPSLHLPNENVIKHTLRIDGSEKIKTSHYTRAIKSNRRFALLFSRRVPDLSLRSYDFSKIKTVNVIIDSYDPTHFTLFYSVLVGPKGLEFKVPDLEFEPLYNTIEKDCGLYRVVIIYSFLSLPSHYTGSLNHSVTKDPLSFENQEEREGHSRFIDGLEPLQAFLESSKHFVEMADEMVLLCKDEVGIEDPDIKRIFEARDFYREGRRGSKSWNHHLKNCTLSDLWLLTKATYNLRADTVHHDRNQAKAILDGDSDPHPLTSQAAPEPSFKILSPLPIH